MQEPAVELVSARPFGDADVVRKVLGDFEAAGTDFSEHRLRKKMDELLVVAKEQVKNE